MGRKPAPRQLPDVRRAALAAARDLFARRGFDGTAIQDVASAVGVTKQAVLHHFRTKEELREAVLAELFGHWALALPRLLADASGGEDPLGAVFGELLRFFYGERGWATLIVRELLDRPEQSRARLERDVRPWIDAVAGYVRAAQQDAVVPRDLDPEAWALEMLQLTLFGAASHAVLAGALSGDGEQRLAQELTRLARSSLFRGEAPDPKGERRWGTSTTTTRTSGSRSRRASTGPRSSS